MLPKSKKVQNSSSPRYYITFYTFRLVDIPIFYAPHIIIPTQNKFPSKSTKQVI